MAESSSAESSSDVRPADDRAGSNHDEDDDRSRADGRRVIDLGRALGADASEALGAEGLADIGGVIRSNEPGVDGPAIDQVPSFFVERGTLLDERP